MTSKEHDEIGLFEFPVCDKVLLALSSQLLLVRLMEDRVSRLHAQLQRVHQSQLSASPVAGQSQRNAASPVKTTAEPCTVLNSINEDLHWLILVAGEWGCRQMIGFLLCVHFKDKV